MKNGVNFQVTHTYMCVCVCIHTMLHK